MPVQRRRPLYEWLVLVLLWPVATGALTGFWLGGGLTGTLAWGCFYAALGAIFVGITSLVLGALLGILVGFARLGEPRPDR